MADKTAEGSWVDPREDRATTQYAVMNRINSDQEGVSFEDLETMIRVGMPRMAELRAADGLWVISLKKKLSVNIC